MKRTEQNNNTVKLSNRISCNFDWISKSISNWKPRLLTFGLLDHISCTILSTATYVTGISCFRIAIAWPLWTMYSGNCDTASQLGLLLVKPRNTPKPVTYITSSGKLLIPSNKFYCRIASVTTNCINYEMKSLESIKHLGGKKRNYKYGFRMAGKWMNKL